MNTHIVSYNVNSPTPFRCGKFSLTWNPVSALFGSVNFTPPNSDESDPSQILTRVYHLISQKILREKLHGLDAYNHDSGVVDDVQFLRGEVSKPKKSGSRAFFRSL